MYKQRTSHQHERELQKQQLRKEWNRGSERGNKRDQEEEEEEELNLEEDKKLKSTRAITIYINADDRCTSEVKRFTYQSAILYPPAIDFVSLFYPLVEHFRFGCRFSDREIECRLSSDARSLSSDELSVHAHRFRLIKLKVCSSSSEMDAAGPSSSEIATERKWTQRNVT